uniref:Integrase catalytic domain-containing protein n=1 Tax=Scylla olivacea TaxID=85551 RepID=A0A0P4WJM0_SCYOL
MTRKELAVVVKCLSHIQHYLYGAQFTVWTDHVAFRWLKTLKELEGQLPKWMGRLEQRNYQIVHLAGRVHNKADSLSCCLCKSGCVRCSRREPGYSRPVPSHSEGQQIPLHGHGLLHEVAGGLPKHEAETVAEFQATQVFTRFGVPGELHSDQGREFKLWVFQDCCRFLWVKICTTPLQPQSDGMVDRYNATLVSQLARFCVVNQ